MASYSRAETGDGWDQTISKTVSAIASTREVVAGPITTSHKSVPFAGLRDTVPSPTHGTDFPIVTPLVWERWEAQPKDAGRLDDFHDVIHCLKFGFKIGVSSSIPDVFSPIRTR
jgi:hypothetical protein